MRFDAWNRSSTIDNKIWWQKSKFDYWQQGSTPEIEVWRWTMRLDAWNCSSTLEIEVRQSTMRHDAGNWCSKLEIVVWPWKSNFNNRQRGSTWEIVVRPSYVKKAPHSHDDCHESWKVDVVSQKSPPRKSKSPWSCKMHQLSRKCVNRVAKCVNPVENASIV